MQMSFPVLLFDVPVTVSAILDVPRQMSLVEAAKVGDLEAEATPESIMLSTMTAEGEKERTDREMVVPWLKFLWETYRAVLDILKTNTKLEHVYHATCIKAFNFCRSVCNVLRIAFRISYTHLCHIKPADTLR